MTSSSHANAVPRELRREKMRSETASASAR
jgi:hypothetical protein